MLRLTAFLFLLIAPVLRSVNGFKVLSSSRAGVVERQQYALGQDASSSDYELLEIELLAPTTANIPSYELEALWDLYNSTRGDAWRWINATNGIPWSFTADANPCRDNWQGIKCILTGTASNQIRHVSSIRLPAHYMNGSLPDSLGNLTFLTSIRMFANRLTGTIPHTLGKLTQLTDVDLAENWITGTIPDTFSALINMSTFLAGSNYLSGTISNVFQHYTTI
eukprot:gene25134-28415_t